MAFHTMPTSKTENLFLELSNYLKNSRERVTREELEQYFHYSADYLNRIVHKYSGKTLNLYARDYVMERAATMLTASDMSVTEVCEKLGYSNRSFFTKEFAGRYGMTSLEYKKKKRLL